MFSKTSLFSKSVLFSYITKSLSLLVGIIYTYIIARYLGPKDYGLISYYIAFIGSIINISGIYFIQGLISVFTPKLKSDILFKKIIRWQYVIIGITFPVLYILSDDISTYLEQENYLLLRYSAILLLLLPLFDSYRYLFQGFKNYGKILKTKTTVDTVNLLVAIFLVITLRYGTFGVVYARIVSTIIGIIIFAHFYKKLDFKNKSIDTGELKRYSYNSFFVILFKSANTFIFTIIIGKFVSLEMLGMYYIAQKAISYSMNAFQTSMNEVLLSFTSDEYGDKKKLGNYLSYSTKISITVSIISVLLITIIGKPLLANFLPEYLPAYNLILIYGIYNIILSFCALNTAFMSMNRMDMLANIYLINLIMTSAASIIIVPSYGIQGAISALIIGGVIYAASILHYIHKLGLEIDLVPRKKDITYITRFLKR